MEGGGSDIQMKAQTKQKIHFKKVHFCCADPSHFCIICIVVVRIIHKFGRNKNASDKQAMNIEGIDGQRGLSLNKAIEINVGNDETTGTAIGVLKDSV